MVYLKIAKRVDPKNSYHKAKKNVVFFFTFVAVWNDEC